MRERNSFQALKPKLALALFDQQLTPNFQLLTPLQMIGISLPMVSSEKEKSRLPFEETASENYNLILRLLPQDYHLRLLP